MSKKQNRYTSWNVKLILLLATTLFLAIGCTQKNSSVENNSTPLRLTSTAFEDNGRIDMKYTKRDQNISIPLAWNKAPMGTKSFAIVTYDLHPVANNWIHWAIVDIPASVLSLEEGVSKTDKLPKGSKELHNSFGLKGYDGPQPPAGSGDHEYKTILFALDVKTLDIQNSRLTFDNFQKLVEEHIIDSAEISGFYEN